VRYLAAMWRCRTRTRVVLSSALPALVACSGAVEVVPSDAAALPVALSAVEAEPARSVELCAELATPSIRHDCMLHGVEHLARRDPDAASGICARIPAGLDADECFFQVAERSRQPARCAQAGRFEEDCRMHAWSARVPHLAGPADGAAEWRLALSEAAAEMGFDADDARPWVAAARFILGRDTPLDRAFCDGWPVPQRTHCRVAGRDLFHDRINHVRDARKWDCEGPPPALLAFTQDDELDAILSQRRVEICP